MLEEPGKVWLYLGRVTVAAAWRMEGAVALEFGCMSESPKEPLKSLASPLYCRLIEYDWLGCDPGIHDL